MKEMEFLDWLIN